ncbi:MAG: M3 family oligoendopeptidase, partial [Chloroflexota bacterium]
RTQTELPKWDVSTIYPSLISAEFIDDFNKLVQEIDKTTELFDRFGVNKQINAEPSGVEEIDEAYTKTLVSEFETILGAIGELTDLANTIRAYIYSFVSTDSRDEAALSRLSDYQKHASKISILSTRFIAWVGSIDIEQLCQQSALANEHAFLLQRASRQSMHLMNFAEESLAAEMTLSGGSAWAKLHGTYTSQIMVDLPDPIESVITSEAVSAGSTPEQPLAPHLNFKQHSMSATRNFAYHPSRAVRKQAYEAEIATWEQHSVTLAACMNGVKGEVVNISRRRGWESPLAQSLFDNNINHAILDAMMDAAHDAFPDFRRYMHIKARMLKLDKLAWYDLFAPVVSDGQHWAYQEATAFILEQFTGYSNEMGELAQRAFAENWIDAGPRVGKRDGAFCMRIRGDESRILANYKPSYAGLNTLAHELGHAYHGIRVANCQPLLRQYPMTLAETASIFCETIVRQAALKVVSKQEQLNILESTLMSACQVVVDISSRFLFEQSIFEQRAKRELSISELNELMLDAQRQTYGDGVDETQMHPYMWAVKQHYYSTTRSFYNYPYMFGLLFGLGLYARYVDDPATFRAGYDDLLSSTGTAPADQLAARFGIDISDKAFWASSLDVVRSDIARFETLAV